MPRGACRGLDALQGEGRRVGRRRRARASALVREEIGPNAQLMIDANQHWDVDEAIERVRALARFDLWWIEEPTSPDDVLGHAAIAKAVGADRRGDRRALRQPRSSSSSCCRRARSTSARSTAAGSAASTRTSR